MRPQISAPSICPLLKSILRKCIIISIIFYVLLESLLRAVPLVIPVALLNDFTPNLRAHIAERLQLPTKRGTFPLLRDDNGPPLYLFRPFQKIRQSLDEASAIDIVEMDRNGFCNPTSLSSRITVDILAIGDSFTWCVGVNPGDTWISQLETMTGRSTYSLGQPGRGLYEYLQIFLKHGLPKTPHIVMLNFYEGNDLRDAVLYDAYRRSVSPPLGGSSVDDQRTIITAISSVPILRDSYALNALITLPYELYDMVFPSDNERHVNFRYSLQFSEAVDVPFNTANVDREEVLYAQALKDQIINLDLLMDGLRRYDDLSKKYNFIPMVLYTPSAHTVYMSRAKFEDGDLKNLLKWFSEAQRQFLETQGARLGYRFIDVTSALQEQANRSESDPLLYFPTNLHLTKAGHRAIAESIAQRLSEPPSGR